MVRQWTRGFTLACVTTGGKPTHGRMATPSTHWAMKSARVSGRALWRVVLAALFGSHYYHQLQWPVHRTWVLWVCRLVGASGQPWHGRGRAEVMRCTSSVCMVPWTLIGHTSMQEPVFVQWPMPGGRFTWGSRRTQTVDSGSTSKPTLAGLT